MKKYINENVFEAAKKRIEYIFDSFEHISVSFSGGKDSSVCMHLACEEARKRNRKIGVMFVDTEAQYQMTIDYVKKVLKEYKDVVIPFWICLPMKSQNSLSFLEPTWVWWAEEKRSLWVREIPENAITLQNNPLNFYKKNMTFETFVKKFGDWYGNGEKVACIQGIRADESLNRFRAVTKNKNSFNDIKWSTLVSKRTFNFYPIYDWRAEDIWVYNGTFEKSYNGIYDLMYKAGLSIYQMRVDEPFGNEAKAGLNLFKVIEPKTWCKVVNRVSGANFGNIYHGKKIMNSNYTLPKNHTWKSFTKFLLSTLPEEAQKNYKTKFIKFIKYWNKKGCPVKSEHIEVIKEKYNDYAYDTGMLSNRGSKDKNVVKFKKIADEMEGLDTKDDFLTWKIMAMCIIKNDYLCRSLSFQATKDLTFRQKKIMEKYKNL